MGGLYFVLQIGGVFFLQPTFHASFGAYPSLFGSPAFVSSLFGPITNACILYEAPCALALQGKGLRGLGTKFCCLCTLPKSVNVGHTDIDFLQ